MANKELAPGKGRRSLIRREDNPTLTLQQQMNRMFDDFFRRSNMMPFGELASQLGTFNPHIDVSENEKALIVSAELPGLEEKDVEVSLANNLLTISGEKKQEKEEKDENYYRAERTYGSFSRSVAIPCPIETDKAEAVFKNGVLTVTLPKVHSGESCTKVAVKGG